jgi:hypothetical protein
MQIDFYEIVIPNGWQVKKGDEVSSIFNTNGYGAMQISSFMIPENYNFNLFDEFYDFASEYISSDIKQYRNVEKTTFGFFLDGVIDEHRTWIFAIANSGLNVLLITYNSLTEDFHKEHYTILEMIKSISFPPQVA